MNLLSSFLPLRVIRRHFSKLFDTSNPTLRVVLHLWYLGIPAAAGIISGYLGQPEYSNLLPLLTGEVAGLAFFSAISLQMVSQCLQWLKDTQPDKVKRAARQRLVLLSDNLFFELLLTMAAMMLATVEMFDWSSVLASWPSWISSMPGTPGNIVADSLWGGNIALLVMVVLTIFVCLQRYHYLIEEESERILPSSPIMKPVPVPTLEEKTSAS